MAHLCSFLHQVTSIKPPIDAVGIWEGVPGPCAPTHRPMRIQPIGVAAWLRGCVAAWLCGCVAAWLRGCAAVRLCGCVAVWLRGCVAVWLCGCVAVRMRGCGPCAPNPSADAHPTRRPMRIQPIGPCACVAVWLCGCGAVWLRGCVAVSHEHPTHRPVRIQPVGPCAPTHRSERPLLALSTCATAGCWPRTGRRRARARRAGGRRSTCRRPSPSYRRTSCRSSTRRPCGTCGRPAT